MRRLRIPLLQNNRAVSYAISAIVITATTISLVLVASVYAYQILEQQRGAAEFDVAKESILAFNDALENTAWKPGAVRSSRFTIEYGYLQLIPNTHGDYVEISATLDGNTTPLQLYSSYTGFMRYYLSNKYISFGQDYTSYIAGNKSTLIVGSTGSYGRAVVEQQTGGVTITLDYRVRAMRTSVIDVNGTPVNYVDVWVIKFVTLKTVTDPWSYIHDFDLRAECLSVETIPHPWSTQIPNCNATISVQIGETTNSAPIPLVAGELVFNVVVSEVQVNV